MKNESFSLKFKNRGTYLYAHLSGKDSFADSLNYWNVIADKVAELGCGKLLVHEDLNGNVTESEMFDLIRDLESSGLADIQIAFFDENLDDAALNAFGQSLAIDQGTHIKIFRSLEAARSWIGQDD